MGWTDPVQRRRFEFKYLIDESLASAIRHYICAYLSTDEFTNSGEPRGYPVHSLYLDSESLTLCRASMQGLRNRYKLRIRFYEENGPLFFEIKRRVSDLVLKERAPVRRDAVARLLAGGMPEMADVAEANGHFPSLQRFCELRNQIGADGQVFVSFRREAHVSPNNEVRITFDRGLCARSCNGGFVFDRTQRPWHPQINGVILELKYSDQFFPWMRTMVQMFNLERCSMPKYVKCVSAGSKNHLTSRQLGRTTI